MGNQLATQNENAEDSTSRLYVHVQGIWLIGTINRPLHNGSQENKMFFFVINTEHGIL